MNAKITVTVPINKAHLKVSEFLEEINESLGEDRKSLEEIIAKVSKNIDTLNAIEQIDSLRKNLAYLDAKLEDCYTVLKALVEYRTKKEEKNVNNLSDEG
jgi:hypothetical protein